MSYTVDFNTLKYNLYEVLGITKDATETKIKKAFRNLILNFHPDKNNNAEEEIYYYIITANQILTNNDSRKEYDSFLGRQEGNHFDLKNNFNKLDKREFTNYDKSLALKEFATKTQELEQKHLGNYNQIDKTMDAYNQLLLAREQPIEIVKEEFKSNEDFNRRFEDMTITSYNENQNMAITALNDDNSYTNLDIAYNNLYLDNEDINTNKFTSLNLAFKVQQINTKNFKEVNIKDAIDSYNKETIMFQKPL